MGNPIKIKELAERMIRLSGNSVSLEGVSDGIEIVYSGLRPGEKMTEELLINKNFLETEHLSIKKAIENKFTLNRLASLKKEIKNLISKEEFEEARKILFESIKNN
jgi:FlaA1/EpsC-like NDP-sugar epimerase